MQHLPLSVLDHCTRPPKGKKKINSDHMTSKLFIVSSLSRWFIQAVVLSSVMSGAATGFSSTKVFLSPTSSSVSSETNLQVFVSPTDHDVKIERHGSHYVAAQQQSKGETSPGQAPDDLLKLFNEQVTNEFVASHLYLSASIWFETNDFEGMARYMRSESEDERRHALSLIDFANKRSMPIHLNGVPNGQASSAWSSPLDVWQALLNLEQDNTQSLLRLAEAAQSRHDYAVLAFLNPFHMEQVDSEAKIQTILAKVKDEQKTPGLLRQLDHELGQESA